MLGKSTSLLLRAGLSRVRVFGRASRRWLSTTPEKGKEAVSGAAASGGGASAATAATAAAGGEVAAVTAYPQGLKWLHWAMAGGVITLVATVKKQQWSKDKEEKAWLMKIHKTTGLIMLGLLVPRVAIRLANKMPGKVPGISTAEHTVGNLWHYGLYGFLTAMPLTGVAMGYYGGKGLPFFNYTIPGASDDAKRPDIAKKAYQWHKKLGAVLPYFVAAHAGAAGAHLVRGHKIFARMNPFTHG